MFNGTGNYYSILEYSFPDQPCMSFAWVLFQQELIFSLEYRYRYLSTLGTGTYLLRRITPKSFPCLTF
jgi:hypothetical protein